MAKINIKDLTVEVADGANRKDIDKTIINAVEQISLDATFINLIKVKVGNAPAEQVKTVLKQLADVLFNMGLQNCMLIPLQPQGIQDITIERLEIDRHEESN